MKDSTSVRPCAEFPCDNPKLHSVGVWATGESESLDGADASDEWGVSDRWVHAVKQRWAKAVIDAPEAQLPVLDAGALEVFAQSVPSDVGALEVFAQSVDLDTGALELSDDSAAPASGVLEILADSAAALEAADVDPFIEELLGFVVDSPADMPPLDFDGPADFSPEESGDFAVMPAVAEQVSSTTSAWHEPSAVTGERLAGVQPLAPLAIELTPTPMGVTMWSELTNKLSRYLLEAGHTRAAALVTPMLNGELVELSRLDARALECLMSDGVAEVRGGRPVSSTRFRESARAFREEFSEGGLNADDALFWLSQLLVALGGGSADDVVLENALRELGVAELLECAA